MTVSCPLKTTDLLATKAENLDVPQFGIKGKIILSKQIVPACCVSIDYMHSVLEGSNHEILV